MEQFWNLFENEPLLRGSIWAAFMLLGYFIFFLFTKNVLKKQVYRFFEKTESKIDDSLIHHKVLQFLPHFVPGIIIYYILKNYFPELLFLQNLILVSIIFLFTVTAARVLRAGSDFYHTLPLSEGKSVKGYVQILAIIIYAIGTIIVVAILMGKSPGALLGGLGALMAVMMLVFRDTILSLVASVQISAYDLVRIGDWIEVPSMGIDGDVMDIALHSVTIRNFDKTISVLPTHKLIEVPFKNWKGMQESGGRRIKRAIMIDINSIRLCSDEMIQRFKKIAVLYDYLESRSKEVEEYNVKLNADLSELANGRRLSNVGTFRKYVEAYLQNHPRIRNDYTLMVRQLPPTEKGLPIEVYCFTNTINWVEYEMIQADIFDHILAVTRRFELRVYQLPGEYTVISAE
ncbi:MAG TPA: mechanosensitive ion channel [Candidatus Marinimicrobia bacterium]|nr:mechanosensitive ion channel [Candidatus Neomarinimicrobiota bacterium]